MQSSWAKNTTLTARRMHSFIDIGLDHCRNKTHNKYNHTVFYRNCDITFANSITSSTIAKMYMYHMQHWVHVLADQADVQHAISGNSHIHIRKQKLVYWYFERTVPIQRNQMVQVLAWWPAVKILKPKHRLGQPVNFVFLLSENNFLGSKNPKKN